MMKKEEKYKVQDQLGKMIVQFLNKKVPDGTQYSDLMKMFMAETYAVVKMCVRESTWQGKKLTLRMVEKHTRELFRLLGEASKEERIKGLELLDDEED